MPKFIVSVRGAIFAKIEVEADNAAKAANLALRQHSGAEFDLDNDTFIPEDIEKTEVKP